MFGGQSREIETRNYEKDKHIQTLIVELYLHVSSVNYDGYPVLIDRISMLKYQRLRSTILTQKDDGGGICDGTSTCERLACEYSDVTVVDSPLSDLI